EIQKCLGNNLYGGNLFAMIANISGSMTIAFSQKAYDILELQRTGGTLSIEVPIMFNATDGYTITIPKAQISGDIPSPSGNELVTAEVTYTVVDESPIITRNAV
ncbi:phage tail tube protein, partial [Psychrobacter nivimaris]|uniref:phage tail tube protein n=1 Tax=Psychrobacter nivimaris TaxID=281738 RepID=UPI0030B8FCD2